MTSETASFTDPQFLANFGLNRGNAIEYFLHPLNPFRTKANTCNEILAMQGISISLLMFNGLGPQESGPLTLERAEDEYNMALSRLSGEQYELLPPPRINPKDRNNINDQNHLDPSQSPLFTIRHVLRSKNKVTTLGIYYILEGIIYKAPSARASMKYNVARTCQGLIDVCDTLSVCTNYTPTTGYYWDFDAEPKTKSRKKRSREENNDEKEDDNDDSDEVEIFEQLKKIKRKSVEVDKKRRSDERTDEEEEGIRAKDKINDILQRISKSSFLMGS